jgi:hypothetical protein
MGFGPVKIALTGARNFPNPEELLKPQIHIFYKHRQKDVDDNLPKYSGYTKSEAAVISLIAQGMICSKNA